MLLPFVGDSYVLIDGDASRARTVNMYLQRMETAAKAAFILRSIPGLTLLSTISGACRGTIVAAGRLFAVLGPTLYEIASDGTGTSRGTLSSSSGEVSMAAGAVDILISDGPNGYTFTLASNTFAAITDPEWAGATSVCHVDSWFLWAEPNTNIFSRSEYLDVIPAPGVVPPFSVDGNDYALANSSPDGIVAMIVSHREVIIMGARATERWFQNGDGDFDFGRDQGATAEVGCLAKNSLKAVDNSFMWIGQDMTGGGIVYRDVNRTPVRVSTVAVEEALQQSTDLSSAVAYTYQSHGMTFYCVNAPGLSSTWCYEISTGTWHERCDLDGFGQFEALRVTHAAYCYETHFAFDADGKVYEMDDGVYTLAGDPLKRSRTSPHDVTPLRDRKSYSEFVLDCTTGVAAQAYTPYAEISWSNDGGATFGNPVLRDIGAVGNRYPRAIVRRLGMARDRVYRVETAAPVQFSIISAEVR